MARKKINVGNWVIHADGMTLQVKKLTNYSVISERRIFRGLRDCQKLPASPTTLAKWYRMLPGILKQLEAMNCSSAHAASWCEPRSQLTTKLIKRIRRIAKGSQKGTGRGK